MTNKFKLLSLLLFPLTLIIKFIANKFPNFVEQYYSLSIDKFIIQLLSNLTSLFPFSLYELIMYLLFIIIILFIIVILVKLITDRNSLVLYLKKSLLNILSVVSITYFLFVLLWGINYSRIPLSDTLINIYRDKYPNITINNDHTSQDLAILYKYLISKTNETRKLVKVNSQGIMESNTDYKGIISRASKGYDQIESIIPGLSGNYGKPKYIISSKLMCYTGITGIYFPFTGEANVNVAIPDIYIPSTVLHEMAHQRCFASEDEANFIAYLATINHPDLDFNYSGLILALNHTANILYKVDYKTYNMLSASISQDVKRDLKYNSDFWDKYKGKIDNISNEINNSYLKSNGVKDGVENYGQMVDLLLTYYKLEKATLKF